MTSNSRLLLDKQHIVEMKSFISNCRWFSFQHDTFKEHVSVAKAGHKRQDFVVKDIYFHGGNIPHQVTPGQFVWTVQTDRSSLLRRAVAPSLCARIWKELCFALFLFIVIVYAYFLLLSKCLLYSLKPTILLRLTKFYNYWHPLWRFVKGLEKNPHFGKAASSDLEKMR